MDEIAPQNPTYDCSIIIPLFNKVEYTLQCLESIAAHTPPDRFEVVIVDNASTDGTGALLDRLEGDVTIIRNEENAGFSAACNQGAAAAKGRMLLFLNNDTVAHGPWLEPMLGVLDNEPDVGIVGAKLLFPDRTLQHAGVHVVAGEPGSSVPLCPCHAHYQLPEYHPDASYRRDVSAVTGACLAIRRELFEFVGGFDEEYWNGYEDMELNFRVGELGWRIVYEPATVLTHFESVSGPERFARNQHNVQRLNSRWRDRLIPEVVVLGPGIGRYRTPVVEYLAEPKSAVDGGPPTAAQQAA